MILGLHQLRAVVNEHVDVLVEEVSQNSQEVVYLVQNSQGGFAVLQLSWGNQSPSVPTVLERAIWVPRDRIARALMTSNVHTFKDPVKRLAFLAACAVSLGLVDHEDATRADRLQKRLDEAVFLLRQVTPKRKHAAHANAFLRLHDKALQPSQ